MSGGGGQQVAQTTQVNLSPEQRQLLDLAMPHLQKFAANPPKPMEGSSVAPFTAPQTQGQQQVLGAAAPQQNIVSSAGNANTLATSGALLDPNSNPALQATIAAATRPIEQNLLEKTLPAIRNAAVTTGNFGSSRQGIAEGLASRDASQAIGDTGAKIATAGYNSGLDALLKGIGLAPQTAGAQTIPGATTSAVGDVQQNQQQKLLDELLGKYNYNQQSDLLVGQQLAGIASGLPGAGSTTTGTQPSPNPLLQSLGGAAVGGSLGSSLLPGAGGWAGAGLGAILPFLSDRSTKRNIEKIGQMFDGTPIYRYQYRGSDQWVIGVMADEVKNPEAVREINGLKVVDFKLATDEAARIGA